MTFPLIAAAVLCVPTLLLAGLWWAVAVLRGRRLAGFIGRVAWANLLLFIFHAFVTFPLLLGFIGSRWVDTRPDERGYEGPRIAADGTWLLQDRDSLELERLGEATVDADVARGARQRAVRIPSTDGVELRGFLVEPERVPPRATVVLVHGLFRGALEVEPVAAAFHRLGCETLQLELRNHGGSGRAPATFGLREADDVVAAAAFLRSRPGSATAPLVLFGVSIGTAAVAGAAPRIPRVAGLVLDAPMDDLLSAAHRMLDRTRNNGRRVLALAEPWQSLVLRTVELWSGFAMNDVRPGDALRSLPADVRVLVIGGSEDDIMPPVSVRGLFDSLPMPEARKSLWIRDGSGHGNVWRDAPVDYEQRLAGFLREQE